MFHNIFSQKKEERIKEKSKINITIDNREKNSLVPAELSSLNFNLNFQQLPVGDYIINGTIIERKTWSDLQSSIINKRIFEQLNNLKQSSNSLLIIEGNINNHINTIHPNALKGFLLSLSAEYKIPFIFSKDEKETALYLFLLAKKKINKEISLRQTRIFKTKKEQQQFILEGFPGIGPTTAKKLIKEFSSLNNIFKASESDIKKILGKKAESFKQLLD